MIAVTSSLLWYTTRASGIVSLLLLTAVMVGGIMTATRVGGGTIPRFAVAEVHRRITITSLIKHKISHALWRTIHWISYLAFPIAVVHEILIGTDFRFAWMILLTAACVGAVGIALAWRFWAHPRPGGALTAVPSRTAPPKRSKAIVTRTPSASSSSSRRRGTSKGRPPR